ncbi:MAG: TRAP transporter small permease [Desulfobacteraceae bacterium]
MMVNIVDRISRRLAGILFWVAGASIVAMMLLTCADVILRYFRMPIPGTYELVCFLGTLAVAFAMAHTSVQDGHVAVSIVTQLLPKRGQAILGSITDFFSLVFFALVGWQSIRYGGQLKASGEVSLTLELPFYPFVYGVGIAAFAVCLVLIKRILENAQKAVQPWT